MKPNLGSHILRHYQNVGRSIKRDIKNNNIRSYKEVAVLRRKNKGKESQ